MRALRTAALGFLLLAGGMLATSAFLPYTAHAQAGAARAGAAAAAAANPPTQEAPAQESAAKKDPGVVETALSFLGDTLLIPVAGIAYVFLAIAGTVVGLAGGLFNLSLEVLVFQFATYFGNSAGMLLGWSMLRDVGNILLVFGFVSIGVETILNVGHYSVGKTLPRLVIFAVLLNFSLFVTEAIIDTTNAVAVAVHQQAYAKECANQPSGCFVEKGIAAQVLAVSGIGSLPDAWSRAGEVFSIGSGDKLQRIIAYVLSTIFMVTTAAVLFFGAFLILSRAITLAFLMITSPIGFAGMAIPALNKVAKDWWKALINNALFAPAFVLLMFVSLQVASGVRYSLAGGKEVPSIVDALVVSVQTLDFGGLLVFLLVIGFMFGALLAAKQFGVMGAETMTKMAGAAIGYGTAGLWARTGRFAIGRPMNRLATMTRSSRFGNTLVGDVVAKGLDLGAKRTFDIRGAKGAIKVNGVSLGKVGDFSKDGRPGELKKVAERASKDADLYKDAYKVADRPLQQNIKTLEKEELVERAQAFELNKQADALRAEAKTAEEEGRPEAAGALRARADVLAGEANGHVRQAETIEREKKSVERDLDLQQKGRLTEGEQAVQRYKTAGGKGADMQRDQRITDEQNTQAVKDATAQIATLNDRLAELAKAEASGFIRPADKPAHDAEVAETVAQLGNMQRQLVTANEAIGNFSHIADKEARKRKKDAYDAKRSAFKTSSDKVKKEERDRGAAMLKADYALEQVAGRFERAARSIEEGAGAFKDLGRPLTDSLRNMAGGITAKTSQSKLERLLHDVQHEIEHAQHADHDEGHHDEEGGDDHGATGGGHAAAAGPAHGPDPHHAG